MDVFPPLLNESFPSIHSGQVGLILYWNWFLFGAHCVLYKTFSCGKSLSMIDYTHNNSIPPYICPAANLPLQQNCVMN